MLLSHKLFRADIEDLVDACWVIKTFEQSQHWYDNIVATLARIFNYMFVNEWIVRSCDKFILWMKGKTSGERSDHEN
ncbi:hypothetical protein ACS0PU_011144 [Formica fusca]